MWVRSQHKITLIDANNFYIEEVNKNFDIVTYCNSRFSFRLGTYSTQEKALKVLNAISFNIKSNELARIYQTGETLKAVFQMPQDSEV